MEKTILDKIKETASYIRSNVAEMPDTAVILGSGLGNLADKMDVKEEIDYHEIPNFPVSTVPDMQVN